MAVSRIAREHGQMEVGRVPPVWMMWTSAVGGGVLANPGHHRAEKSSAADDEAQRLARVERESDREQVDLEVDDFARSAFVDPVKVQSGTALAAAAPGPDAAARHAGNRRTLVPENRGTAFGNVVRECALVRHGGLLQRGAVGIKLMDKDEEVHVVGPVPRPTGAPSDSRKA